VRVPEGIGAQVETCNRNAQQMLLAFLFLCGCLPDADAIGHMSFHGNVLFPALVDNGEIGFPRQAAIYLDEVRALPKYSDAREPTWSPSKRISSNAEPMFGTCHIA
jgi:hypothetical protein